MAQLSGDGNGNGNGNGNGRKRIISYARVSTDEQADKGYSLPSQLGANRKYAEQNGFDVVAEFQDDYSGATPIEHRPEGSKAYTMLKSGGADAIVAYTIDRYVRPPKEGDEWDFPNRIRGLADLGKEIHVCDKGKLGTDFGSLLMAMLEAKAAGDERRKFRERTTRGRKQKAKAGKVVGSGRAPYGYRYVRNADGSAIALEIVDAEARIVKLIYVWYTRGDGDGRLPLSIKAIAKRQWEMKIPTPGAQAERKYRHAESQAERKPAKPKGSVWYRGTILRILTNEVYTGILRYGKTITEDFVVKGKRPLDEQIVISGERVVPAIIDRDLWNAAQARLKYNKEMSLRNANPDRYLLRGRVRCGCGAKMRGDLQRGKNYRYRCTHGLGSYPGANCRETIRGDALEEHAWQHIRELLQDKKDFERRLRLAQRAEQDQLAPKRERLKEIEKRIVECDKEADECAAAMRGAKGRVAQRNQLWQDQINARYDALVRQRDELKADLSQQRFSDSRIKAALQFREDVVSGIKNATREDKAYYIEMLDVQVVVKNGEAQVRCLVPERAADCDSKLFKSKSQNVLILESPFAIVASLGAW